MEGSDDRAVYTMAVNPVTIYMDMTGQNRHSVGYLRPLSQTESRDLRPTNEYQMIPYPREIHTSTPESVSSALPERRQEPPAVNSAIDRHRVTKKESGCRSNFLLTITVLSLLIGVIALVMGIYLFLQKDIVTNVSESVEILQSNVSDQRAKDTENWNVRFKHLENLLEIISKEHKKNVYYITEMNNSIVAHEHETDRITENQNRIFDQLDEEIDEAKSLLPNISYQVIQWNVRLICGHSLVIPNGETRTVNYYFTDSGYENYEDCMFQLKTTSSAKLRISFLNFQIELCRVCKQCDYLAVYDGRSTNSNQLFLGCGTALPSALNSSSNIATLWFKTDRTVKMTGFTIKSTTFT